MSRAATILHADLDAFFASVEQRDDPRLRGRPVAVGKGVVMAASYEARAHGVHGGMAGGRARRLCPGLIAVEPRWKAYVDASRAVFGVFERTSPSVEGISIDEAFLDVRGMERIAGTPLRIAERLRAEVRERVGLPITVGVASTKSLAKVASAFAKPDGLLLIPPGGELDFLHPLAVERLWGVGPRTSERLRAHGIGTVGAIAALGEERLVALVGQAAGRHLHALAHNRDRRPVRGRARRRSFGAQAALGRGPHSPSAVDATLIGLVDRVTRRMRESGRRGRTVTLRLRFDDYTPAGRAHTLPRPTATSATVLAAARGLLAVARPTIERRGLTLVGVALSGLEDALPCQLELPLHRGHEAALDAALDAVRDRYGPGAIVRASLMGRDPALSTWLVERRS